jgi:hypothetical protein
MKISIDTDAKTIELEAEATLTEIIEFLKNTFKNEEWKDYKLVGTKTVFQYYPYYPYYPYYSIEYKVEPFYSPNTTGVSPNTAGYSVTTVPDKNITYTVSNALN